MLVTKILIFLRILDASAVCNGSVREVATKTSDKHVACRQKMLKIQFRLGLLSLYDVSLSGIHRLGLFNLFRIGLMTSLL